MTVPKYPSIKYRNEVDALFEDGTVLVQEKLDGANFRFMHRQHLTDTYEPDKQLVFGSRNILWKNEKDVSGAFTTHPETNTGALQYVRDAINMDAYKEIDEQYSDGIVVYCEAMHPHTLQYNWSETPRVVAYDVYDRGSKQFLTPTDARNVCNVIGIPYTPILDNIPANDISDYTVDELVPDSMYRDGQAEGVVLKNAASGARAKVVTSDFKEKHGSHNTNNGDGDGDVSDTHRIVDTVVTTARVEKTAYKLIDEGDWSELCMEMMQELPEAVIRDAVTEEAGTIVMTRDVTIDTSEFRSVASKKCARVLQNMLQSPKHVRDSSSTDGETA